MPYNVPEDRRAEFNKGVASALGVLGKSVPLDAFNEPLTAQKVAEFGLLGEDGKATPNGELFFNLKEAGLFDDSGTLTDKGRAYAVPESELANPENWRAFKMQWDDEIIRPSATFGEVLGATGDFAYDAAAGTGKRVWQEMQSAFHQSKTWSGFTGQSDNRPQKLKDEMAASGLGLIEGAVENAAQWGGMADVASSWIGKKLYDVLPGEMEDAAEEALYLSRQRQWGLQQDIQSLEAGEIAEHVMGVDGAIQEVDRAKAALGDDEFARQYKQASSASQLLADPTNIIPAAVATKAATMAPLATRAALRAQQIIGRTAAMDMKIAGMQTALAAGETVLKKEAMTGPRWAKLAANLTSRGAAEEAAKAGTIASRLTEDAAKVRAALPSLTAELEQTMAQRASLATRIPEAAAQKVIQTMEIGRKVRFLPANVVGATLERVGNGLSRTDSAITGFLKERGLDQLYSGAVGAAGMLGLAGNPVIGALGVGAGVLKTGKLLESYGKMFRYVGKEMAQARGQIPFWKRVAAHTAPGGLNRGLAHTFGMFELGGATSDILRRTGRGIAAAAPVDLAFEWLGDGADLRKQTVYQALSESMVIGGSFAAGGGAFMGTKARMRELALNDEINFRQGLTDRKQKALFEAVPSESRRAIATYSIANPTLNFIFTNQDGSHYDPNSNTATIDVASSNPLKALIAHEVLHHTIIKNNMEGGIAALFLGDVHGNTTGGLLRSKTGELDPQFAEFVETYNRRMDNAGYPRPKLEELAVEYFIEQHADQYSDMAESGELGALAARGAARRWMGSALESILPKSAVLKDLHHKMGGAMDASGANVMGNGLLADGIRQLPAAKQMFRDMNRRSAGLVPGQFEPLGADSDAKGPTITLDPTRSIDVGLLHPLIQMGDDGKPILRDGKPIAIDKATDVLRGAAGFTVLEKLRESKAAGKKYAPGEMHLDDNGDLQGRWLSPEVLRSVIAQNKYNPEQAQVLRSVNAAIKTGDGSRMVMIYFAALRTLKNGKKVYAPQAATLRDTVPVGLTITKDGNLLIGLMSVTKLHENIVKRAQTKRGKRLYGGNVDMILQDVRAMMDYHKRGEDSLEHFAKKYGAVEADERKKFINTMFGLLNQKEQAVLNPLLLEDGVTSKDNVHRTYRVDRVSKAVPMDPAQNPAMPFNYDATSAVKMPEPDLRHLPEAETGGQTAQNPLESRRERPNQKPETERDFSPFAQAKGESIGSFLAEDERFRLPGTADTLGWKTLGLTPEGRGLLQEQAQALREFAYDHRKTLVRKEHPANFIAEAGEHVVERHPSDRSRVIKYAKEFGFTLFVDMPDLSNMDYRAANLRKALPTEYFERMELQNRFFGDDIRVEGLTWGGNPVISQKFIDGVEPLQSEINQFMLDLDFKKVTDDADVSATPVQGTVWIHPEEGIIVGDARPDNFRKLKDGSLVPIDLLISRTEHADKLPTQPIPSHDPRIQEAQTQGTARPGEILADDHARHAS